MPAAASTPAAAAAAAIEEDLPAGNAASNLDAANRSVAAPVGVAADHGAALVGAAVQQQQQGAVGTVTGSKAMLVEDAPQGLLIRQGNDDWTHGAAGTTLLHQDIHLSELHPTRIQKEAYVLSTCERAGVHRTCSWLVTPRESCCEHSCT
jgi:hypothetical protein